MDEKRDYEVENGIDAQEVLDDTEIEIDRLVKKKRTWTGIAIFWFIVWLLIIMYMFFLGTSHQDTITPTPIVTEEPEPEPEVPVEPVESIQVYEYNLRSEGLSEFSGDLMYEDNGTRVNISAISAYDSIYKVDWSICEGDNKFTAIKEGNNFICREESLKNITGNKYLAYIYGGAIEVLPSARPIVCVETGTDTLGIDAIAVILPSSVSDEEILKGASNFKEKVQSCSLQLRDGIGSIWNIDNMTMNDFEALLSECFSAEAYHISSYTAGIEDVDITISGYEDNIISIPADKFNDGDKLVYITLERYFIVGDMHGNSSAAYYSKYLQGDSSLSVVNDFNTLNETVSKAYGQ